MDTDSHAIVVSNPAEHGAQRAEPRSGLERVLLSMETLLALGALGGAVGVAFGNILGEATAQLPWGSSLLAGVALAAINGLLPLAVVAAALRGSEWALWGHFVVGSALMAWIVVQVYFLGPPMHWLQILYFGWGVVIVALAASLQSGAWIDRRHLPTTR